MTLVHSTLALNEARPGGPILADNATFNPGLGLGGNIFTTNGSVILQNTIIANSLAGSNCFGVLIDNGNNLSSDASCQFVNTGSLNNTDPRLSPLDDFGGPTPTMALLAGSPAIDGAFPFFCPATDQRGIARPFGSGCDIGAFESAPPYSVRGFVVGSPAIGSVSLSNGEITNTLITPGQYVLASIPPGTFTIIASASNAVVVPVSRTVTVGSDIVRVDFKAYQLNALTIESYTNHLLHLIFAGTSGQSFQMQTTTDLSNWTDFGMNSVGTNGITDFFYTNTLTEGSRFFRTRRP